MMDATVPQRIIHRSMGTEWEFNKGLANSWHSMDEFPIADTDCLMEFKIKGDFCPKSHLSYKVLHYTNCSEWVINGETLIPNDHYKPLRWCYLMDIVSSK